MFEVENYRLHYGLDDTIAQKFNPENIRHSQADLFIFHKLLFKNKFFCFCCILLWQVIYRFNKLAVDQ